MHGRSGWMALAITSMARAVVTLVLSLTLVTLVPAIAGWTPTVVMTGSMAPVVVPGDVVVSRPISTTDLRFGQVVLVDDPDRPGALRLHRLVGATDAGRLVLRGDRNDHDDSSTVSTAALRGLAALRVPMIGFPFLWAAERDVLPLVLAAALAAALLAGCFLFRPDRHLGGSGPPAAKPRRRPTARQVQAVVGATTAVLLVAVGATPAWAAFSRRSTNPGDTYGAAARFRCSDRFSVDSPVDWWKLAESSGPTAADQITTRPGTYSGTGVTYGDAGPCPADKDTAVTLSGASDVGVTVGTATDTSTLTSFTEEVAVRTTTTAGGLLMGLWASPTSSTGSRDRVVAMSTSGQIVFGMIDQATGTGVTATSPASYNDGAWHLIDAVYAPDTGLRLFVDGTSVATAAAVTTATQSLYWRIGFGDVSLPAWIPAGSSAPAAAFAGSLADALVYATALPAARITNHAAAVAGAQNYAEGRNAWQSSSPNAATAARAVDGNTDGVFARGSVSETDGDPNSWWQVDLQNTLAVSSIKVWNRTDCCGERLSDYWVFVSATLLDTSLTPAQQAATPGVWSQRLTSAPSPSTTITPPAGTRGRFVMVQLQTPSTTLDLAEVQVYGTSPMSPPPDVALGASSSQSSTVFGGVSARAVDGSTDGTFNLGSVTHTDGDANSWWTADLGSSRSLGSLAVWNRTDCCGTRLSDFWVFVSSTPFDTALAPATQAAQPGVWSVHLTRAPSPVTTIPLPAATTGRYVMVQEQTANQNLSLAEVQAFAP